MSVAYGEVPQPDDAHASCRQAIIKVTEYLNAAEDRATKAKGERDFWKKKRSEYYLLHRDDEIRTLKSALTEADARVAVLVEALEPFKQLADYFDARLKANGDQWGDEDGIVIEPPSEMLIGDCRRAKAAISDLPTAATALLSRLEAAEKNARTPGTYEVCNHCSAPASLMKLGCQHEDGQKQPVDGCPIRTARVQRPK